MDRPIGILYEHPLWFEPLFAELDRRHIAYEKVFAPQLVFDPSERTPAHSVVVNRMSPSAWTRGHANAIFHSAHFLAYLDEIGANVVNGHAAYQVELSKVRQYALIAGLGLRHPRTVVVNSVAAAPAAASGLRYPVMVKLNIGGSGAGIRSFTDAGELASAVSSGELELGLDSTALGHEQLPAADDAIVRLEILDGDLLYAIRLRLVPESFNLCPADYCELPGIADGVSGRGLPVERFEPPPDVVDDAKRIIRAAGMDLGGVEYLVDARDGLPYFYDVNALSNFVASAPDVIGFDPFVDLVDFIVARAERSTVPAAA